MHVLTLFFMRKYAKVLEFKPLMTCYNAQSILGHTIVF
jgi:hypothetical protein